MSSSGSSHGLHRLRIAEGDGSEAMPVVTRSQRRAAGSSAAVGSSATATAGPSRPQSLGQAGQRAGQQPSTRSGSSSTQGSAFNSPPRVQYDPRGLSPVLRSTIQSAINDSDLAMLQCWQEAGLPGENHHYKFRLREDIEIDLDSQNVVPSCSACVDSEDYACRHVFWLNDEVIKAKGGTDCIFTFRMNPNGAGGVCYESGRDEPAIFSTWQSIRSLSLEGLAARRNWSSGDPQAAHDRVALQINDMLSLFEPQGRLPHEFASQPDTNLYRRYADILITASLSNPALLNSLRTHLTEPRIAHHSFEKLSSRMETIFSDFHAYLHGPAPQPGSAPADVPNTATRLLALTTTLDTFLATRPTQPSPLPLRTAVADFLLEMLLMVLERDFDVLQRASIHLPPTVDMPRDRNLYLTLIGQSDPRAEEFALRSLESVALRGDVFVESREEVEAVEAGLRVKGAPRAFLARFKQIVG